MVVGLTIRKLAPALAARLSFPLADHLVGAGQRCLAHIFS
jgi:hypothetical protein